jgi:hypothetical protein
MTAESECRIQNAGCGVLVVLLLSALSLSSRAGHAAATQSAASEPQNWLTYSGSYRDALQPARPDHAAERQEPEAAVGVSGAGCRGWQTSPLVVDGVMYLTQRLNDVVALDATTGRAFWIYRYTPAADRIVCCGANNRGLAILGDTLFMGDARRERHRHRRKDRTSGLED